MIKKGGIRQSFFMLISLYNKVASITNSIKYSLNGWTVCLPFCSTLSVIENKVGS